MTITTMEDLDLVIRDLDNHMEEVRYLVILRKKCYEYDKDREPDPIVRAHYRLLGAVFGVKDIVPLIGSNTIMICNELGQEKRRCMDDCNAIMDYLKTNDNLYRKYRNYIYTIRGNLRRV